MTGAEFSGVDIDLLADYVGGALDGTPDEAVVAALIVEDPSWRDAHDLLSGAVVTVNTQLRALGSTPEPMPADVLARLDAALLEASDAGVGTADRTDSMIAPVDGVPGRDVAGATAGPVLTEPGGDGAAPVRRLTAVPSGSGRRARRLRWAAPVGIAAGVLAFLGFGVQQWDGSASDQSASSAGSAAEQSAPRIAGAQELAVPGGSAQILASGTDYRRGTLGQVGSRAMVAPDLSSNQADAAGKSVTPPDGVMSGVDDALLGLRAQDALTACIEAIDGESGVGPITAQTIDFARFDGAPAVVVQFTAAGDTWVWASGPRCGTPGVGADKLAAVRVG